MGRLNVLLAVVLSSAPTIAFGAPAGVSQSGLRGHVELTSPGPEDESVLRVSAGTDYQRGDGTLYKGDGARQWRRYIGIETAPFAWLSLAGQWRELDTLNKLASPGAVRVRGDGLYSIKAARHFAEWSGGVLAHVRRYVDEPDLAPAVFLLGGRSVGAVEVAAQAGWLAERHVVLRPGLSAIEAYAYQKPQFNAVALRLAASYAGERWQPFVEFSQEAYVGAGRSLGEQPKRLALGAHVETGIRNFVVTPRVQAGTAFMAPRAFPAEPAWRGGLMLTYAQSLAPVWAALFPEPGRYTGIVTDMTHGYPLEQALVVFGGRDLAMQRDGSFLYEGRGGTFALRIEAPGYVPVTAVATVASGEARTARFGLRRNIGTVRGRVFLGDASTAGGATLRLINAALVFETDPATGKFSFELPPDAYAFEVSAPGFLPEKRSFVVRLGKEVVFDQLILRPAPKPRAVVVEAPKPATEPVTAAAPATGPVAKVPPALPPTAPEPAPAPEPPAVTARLPLPSPASLPPPPKPPRVDPEVEREQQRERVSWPPTTEALPARLESPVFFEFGSWRVDPRSKESLDRLAALIRSDKSIQRVVIEGRADVVGSEAANRLVAGRRADAIFEALVARGVPASKLTTTSTVYTRRAVGQSDVQRAQDRRVGFRIERE